MTKILLVLCGVLLGCGSDDAINSFGASAKGEVGGLFYTIDHDCTHYCSLDKPFGSTTLTANNKVEVKYTHSAVQNRQTNDGWGHVTGLAAKLEVLRGDQLVAETPYTRIWADKPLSLSHTIGAEFEELVVQVKVGILSGGKPSTFRGRVYGKLEIVSP